MARSQVLTTVEVPGGRPIVTWFRRPGGVLSVRRVPMEVPHSFRDEMMWRFRAIELDFYALYKNSAL